jgi:hypothetical protein
MPATAVLETIRAIFLHREPYVTKQMAAKLLGWSVAQLRIAIAAGDVETYGTCRGERVPLSEVATIARERWQPSMIEQALGDDAAAILPAALRTRSIRLRLSRYQIAALQHLAEKDGVTVDALAARKIDLLMSERSEELAGVIDDFAIALNWPEPHDAQPVG